MRRRLRYGLVAVLVGLAMMAGMVPARADGPPPPPPGPIGGGGTGGACAQGPGGSSGITFGYPGVTTTTLGLTLPVLDPQPIDTYAVIGPNPGESWTPVELLQVRAVPMDKVLKNGTVDPGQAVMEWRFRVRQHCPDTGVPVICDYTYHEMPDGSIGEIAPGPDGQPFEHAWDILCQGGWAAFRAPGAPQDLGARLLAAAKANVSADQIVANATSALANSVLLAAGFPGVQLSQDMSAWVSAIAGIVGITGLPAGKCISTVVKILSSEIVVWNNLLTIAAVGPIGAAGKAAAAVAYKVISTWNFAQLGPVCITESAGSAGTLAYLYEVAAAFGGIVWMFSNMLLVVYGLDFAINYWLAP